MQQPSSEEKIQHAIERISIAINGLSGTIDHIYQDWKFPVKTMNEHMQPEWDRIAEENRFEEEIKILRKQNRILIITVIVATVGVVITALVGVVDIYLRFLGK